ncbi:MAG: LOG family protein, partial [Rhodoplanes sp.]
MSELRSVCIYCGSSPGSDPAFVAAARQLGKVLAETGISLVYGGGSTGMMGALAVSVYEHGGEVIGVIPDFLRQQERMFDLANEIVVTRDM